MAKSAPDEMSAQLKKLETILSSVDRLYPNTRLLLWRSFISGLFMALGSTIGLAIVLAIISVILTQLKVIQALNSFIEYWKINQYLPTK